MGRSRSRSNDRKKSKRDKSPSEKRKPGGKWDEGFGGVYLPTSAAAGVSNLGLSLPTVGELRMRKLIVNGIPKEKTANEVVDEFASAILSSTISASGIFPVVSCTFLSAIGQTRSAMLEFRTPVGASVALTVLEGKFKMKRPKDFPTDADPAGISQSELTAVTLADLVGSADRPVEKNNSSDTLAAPDSVATSPRLSVYGLPGNMLPEQIIRDLFSQFGKLRFLSFPKDLVTGLVKPGASGHVEFEEFPDSLIAETALNGFPCGNSVVKITRVAQTAVAGSAGVRRPVAPSSMATSVTCKILTNPLLAAQVKTGREIGSRSSLVVQLLNAVYPEDILADADYNDIFKEVKEEASKFGFVESIKIPRGSVGVGKIFVQFLDMTAARKFQAEFNGRNFDTRVVCAAFYPLDRFLQGKYVLYAE